MRVIRKVKIMQRVSSGWKKSGADVGFVPTMGALHKGHLSLIRRASRDNDKLVVSIFVNPTQFGPQEDYGRYPRPLRQDLVLCRKEGVDAIFLPSVKEMYSEGAQTVVSVQKISQWLCGSFRPGHFDGVATVVAKLFNAVEPNTAYFGMKDFQQLIIVQQMTKDLNLPVRIMGCPTIRGKDGLALSSRNVYLTGDQRNRARVLPQTLFYIRDMIQGKKIVNLRDVRKALRRALVREKSVQVDYAELCDPKTLEPVQKIVGPVLIAAAIRIGKTRLIDNVLTRGFTT